MALTERVRWGVIAATARVARDYTIPAIMNSDKAELVAVASRNLTNAQEIASGLDICRAYGDYDSLIADHSVEAVYIPLPNNLHVGWAVEAMNNGKHVLCEEPLAVTAAESMEMLETSQDNGVLLSEAMMYYYHPLQSAVEDVIRSGRIGKVSLVKASVSCLQHDQDDHRFNAQMGGGSLLDVGCYCVHIARKAFGSEPTSVTAHSEIDPESKVDTTTTAQLIFPSGLAMIDCSFSMANRSTYEIVGTEGSITVPLVFVASDMPGEFVVNRTGEPSETVRTAACDMFAAEIDQFSSAVRTLPNRLLGPEDAVANMVVLDAIASSARSERQVSIPG